MYQIYAELRDEKGLTDYAVSVATGIAKSTFSEWKNGTYKPKYEKMKKLADYFGVTVEYLMSGKKPAAAEQETAEK